MSFDDINHLLEIIERILIAVKSIGQLFQGLEEAVQVHLIVIAAAYHIFIYYIVMSFQNMCICQPWVLWQLLELWACYEIVTFLSSQNLEHFLGIWVQI